MSKDPSVAQLGQRLGLSPLDVEQADLLYKCNGKLSLIWRSTGLVNSCETILLLGLVYAITQVRLSLL